VDVIIVTGDHAILAAQRATTTIPILGSTDDMVEAGLEQIPVDFTHSLHA